MTIYTKKKALLYWIFYMILSLLVLFQNIVIHIKFNETFILFIDADWILNKFDPCCVIIDKMFFSNVSQVFIHLIFISIFVNIEKNCQN